MSALSSTQGTHFDEIPIKMPVDTIPKDANLDSLPAIASEILTNLSADHLVPDAMWRDHLSMTGRVRTLSGRDGFISAWKVLSAQCRPSQWKTSPAMAMHPVPGHGWAVVPITFHIDPTDGLAGTCSGSVSLVPGEDGQWRVWCLATMLEGFDGEKNPDSPPTEPSPAGTRDGLGGSDVKQVETIVVGAGHNGLALAGRLQATGVPYVLIDKNAELGQNWTRRYDSVRMHTMRDLNHLPFERTWTNDDPLWLPPKSIAEGYERYVQKYNVECWMSTSLDSAIYDEATQQWTATVTRNGVKQTLKSRNLALGLGGGSSLAKMPTWQNEGAYKGELMHMVDYRNSHAWKGKKTIVVGSGTAAHDVARDMVEAGAEVTMIQRSPTAVFPREWAEQAQGDLYNPVVPTDFADRAFNLIPWKVPRDLVHITFKALAAAEHERFDALDRAGFLLDRDTPMVDLAMYRFGGYYIDDGTSAMIGRGEIKVKAGVPVTGYTASGLELEDGTRLDADAIVLATGYQIDYKQQVAPLIGREMTERAGEVWGLDAEGELRGLMRPLGDAGLWYLMGNAPQGRFNSRIIALQMQATMLGKPLREYKAEK